MIEGKKVLYFNNGGALVPGPGILVSAGCSVETVSDAAAGLQRLQSGSYDIIIVQERFGTESWRLCEQIRRASGRPLIVISGDAGADACVRAINAGADFFLRKSFGPLELVARVRSLLQRLPQRHPEPVAT